MMSMIGAMFCGNDDNMIKLSTLDVVCMWKYVSMKVGFVIVVFEGHDRCDLSPDGALAVPGGYGCGWMILWCL